jgi:organic hydroperoxide reductase OsmC/OhrA
VTVRVSLGPVEGGAYGIAVEIDVAISGLERERAEELVRGAHAVCPYSNATRGTVDVILKVI